MKVIKILNYGSGNIGSIISTLTSIGFPSSIVVKEEDILNSDLIVMPGVGSAISAIRNLKKNNYWYLLNERFKKGKFILGICLGAQLVNEYLEEANNNGLGWISGTVKKFQYPYSFNNGWCSLDFNQLKKVGLSRGIKEKSTFYFNHQFYLPYNKNVDSVFIKEYFQIPSLIVNKNYVGIQFHPEKSQAYGKKLLRNIMEDYYGF